MRFRLSTDCVHIINPYSIWGSENVYHQSKNLQHWENWTICFPGPCWAYIEAGSSESGHVLLDSQLSF